MVTSSETIVRTKIFQVAAKLLRSRHGGTRLYRSFSIAGGGGTLGMGQSADYKEVYEVYYVCVCNSLDMLELWAGFKSTGR